MKATPKLLCTLLFAEWTCGCVSSYKNVLVSVVDSTTGQPVHGATVIASDPTASPLTRASRRTYRAATDQLGNAMLRANYLSHEPTLLGRHSDLPLEPLYDVVVANDQYDVHVGVQESSDDLFVRAGSFIPTKPDIVVEVMSKKTSAAIEEKRKLDEQEAMELFRTSPEFWPEQADEPYSFPKGDVGQLLLWKRWENASKYSLGSKDDVESIRAIVIRRMKHPRAGVNQIRWVSTSVVMVSSSWYSSTIAAAGYTYVLRKSPTGWTVLRSYMSWIS